VNRYFLPLILIVALIAGLLWPALSQHLSQYRHIFLFVIMFFVGLEQQLGALVYESRKAHYVLVSLLLNYICFSLLAWGIGWVFFLGNDLFAGFVVLGAVPVTLTSAVVFTRLDRGNAGLALLIVFVSQLVSVALTPQLLSLAQRLFWGGGNVGPAAIAIAPMMGQLALYFLCPLFLGMLARRFLPLEKFVCYLTKPEQLVIAFFVFVGAGQIPAGLSLGHFAKVIGVVLLFQALLSVSMRYVVQLFPKKNQTPLFYTATQKTLPAGLYLILNYFSAAAILPMVLYHLAQLTIGRLYWLPPELKAAREAQAKKR